MGPCCLIGDRDGVVTLVSTDSGDESKDQNEEAEIFRRCVVELEPQNSVDGGVMGRY